MKKLNRILSILLTVAIATSLLVVSGVVPASAANNAWDQMATPSATNQVMANNIQASGLLTTAMNGDLYAFVQTTAATNMNKLAKSTNGGRSWTFVTAPGVITAIFASKSEANVVYFAATVAGVSTLYKSIDSGATFVSRGTVTAPEIITAVGASLVGGSYKVMVGTSTASVATFAGNTYFQDEGQFFLSLTPFGSWNVPAARGNVLDLKLSPNFATDQTIIVLATANGTNAQVQFSTGGGVFGANLVAQTIPSGAGTTMGELALPSDFTASAALFFAGVNGAVGGLYRVSGATTVVAPTLLTSATTIVPVASVDIVGAFATASIIVGGTNGVTQYTTNSGLSFTSGLKQTAVAGGFAWVALKSDYATSLTAYVLESPVAVTGGPNDESGFFMSTDSGKDWNGISLLNSSIFDINTNQLALASNGDMFMITSAGAPGVGDAFTLTSGAAGTVTVTGNVTIVPTAPVTVGGAVPSQTIIYTAGSQVATVTFAGPVAASVTWANDATSAATPFETVDTNGSVNLTATVSGTAFTMDRNATGGNHSLWRNFGGNWERVIGNAAAANINMIAVSPNYATDKGVFYVDNANKIEYSVNNGNTFTAQSVTAYGTPGTITAVQVVDLNTFVVATSAGGIMRTTNNGFIWNQVSTANVNSIVRSSDGTVLVANTTAGALIKSADLGATWSTASTDTAQLLGGINSLTFQNGSNSVLWAVTNTGLFSIDLSAATVAWDTVNRAGAIPTNTLDYTAAFANGVGVASGLAPTGKYVVYAMNGTTGVMSRKLSEASTNVAGNVPVPGTTPLFSSASAMFIQPAVGANKIVAIADGNKIVSFTDQMAAAVAGVAIGSFTTQTAVVNWTALTGADRYAVTVVAGSTGATDAYAATLRQNASASTSISGTTFTLGTGDPGNAVLTANTTYTVSVWAIRNVDATVARVSFAGSKTFSTQPAVVGAPINLAPAAGATGIAVTPGLEWGAVAGATSYTVEISTVPTFATLVGTKQTTTIPAFAWTTPALANNTTYYWRVVAITATGSSDPVIGVFTTVAAPVTQPTATNPPVTVTQTNVTLTTPAAETPGYIWAIIGIGALLVIVVIVLIVRTRRVA